MASLRSDGSVGFIYHRAKNQIDPDMTRIRPKVRAIDVQLVLSKVVRLKAVTMFCYTRYHFSFISDGQPTPGLPIAVSNKYKSCPIVRVGILPSSFQRNCG